MYLTVWQFHLDTFSRLIVGFAKQERVKAPTQSTPTSHRAAWGRLKTDKCVVISVPSTCPH